MLVAELVASALVDAEFPNVFPKSAPSALDFPECIVLVQEGFERESRIECEERGIVRVSCHVVRELAADAESVAIAAEACIRNCSWELHRDAAPWRVAGIDTTAPSFKERDSSGRYVWQFGIEVTAVRAI